MMTTSVDKCNETEFRVFIQTLLKRSGLKEKYIQSLTSDDGMKIYKQAFTHISIDPEENYEYLEILGDVTCNKIIVWYIKDRFPCLQNTAGVKVIARLRINLVSKKNFSSIAETLGLGKYIACQKEIREQREKSLLEDVFEAFIGATEMLVDANIEHGAGYGVCFRLLKSVLDTTHISLRYEDLYDPITRLKETFDFYRSNVPGRHCPLIWGTMLFDSTKTEKGQFVSLYQTDKASNRKVLLSMAEACLLDDAKQMAASIALQKFESKGLKRPIPEYYSQLVA